MKRDAATHTNMQTLLTQIIEEMQRQAKVCETVAQDKTQEALTGASADSEKNTLEAKEWMVKSKVWLEAEEFVRRLVEPPPERGCESVVPVTPTSRCI